jgi:hypothetical protein
MTSDEKGFIVSGWVTLLNKESKKLDLIATNVNNQVVGIGFSGLNRDDVGKQIGTWATKSGFNLVSTETPSQIFAFQKAGDKCQLKF